MKHEIGIGLLIAIPSCDRPTTLEWALALKSLSAPVNFNLEIMTIKHKEVGVAREEAAEYARSKNIKYIFFVGDDTIPPAHSLRQLIFRMEQQEDLGVVGGIYCSKSDPTFPLVFRGDGNGSYWDWKVGEYFEVTGIGMDCTLIRTAVFGGLPKPWFKTVDSNGFLDAVNKAEQWTEDLFFCKNLLAHTCYKIYADSTILCDHVEVSTGRTYRLTPNSLPFRKFAASKTKILDIGCGPIHFDFKEEGDPVRVDIREECNPDYRCDVRQLPFDQVQFDIVFSSHVLEHFSREEFCPVLEEWIRVLKPEGELRLILPNIEWAAAQIVKGIVNSDVLNVLYGAQSNPYDFHYNGLTPAILETQLRVYNFTRFEWHQQHYNMIMRAWRETNELR